MHTESLASWRHEHTFGHDSPRRAERRTLIVTALTIVTMVVEIAAGLAFGSMALLADGLHMGSHAIALGISAFAYIYARRHAADPRFAFGTGKVNALGGFTGAVLLAGFAAVMAGESTARFVEPVPIAFEWAIAVAVVGLLVNGVSVLILGGHGHGHGGSRHHHDHHHEHGESSRHRHHAGGRDFSLRAAYLHVIADALTSLLAIFALLAGKYLGAVWLDPLMGVVGAVLVARWSWYLLVDTSGVLLDRQAPNDVVDAVRESIESHADDRVADLHLWSIGPDQYAAALSVVTDVPREPEHYRTLLPADIGIVHATIEVHKCPDHTDDGT